MVWYLCEGRRERDSHLPHIRNSHPEMRGVGHMHSVFFDINRFCHTIDTRIFGVDCVDAATYIQTYIRGKLYGAKIRIDIS